MTLVAVFFDAPGFEEYPFNHAEYRTAYHELAAEIHAKGGAFAIVRGQGTHRGGNAFSGGWRFVDGAFARTDEPIQADIVYNKGYFRPDERTIMLNDPALDRLCTDKWETYELLPAYFPRTVIVHDAAELARAGSALMGDRLVAKPLDGEEGKGVRIGPREEILRSVAAYPYLLQEFLDTSGGIPGIVEGMHDFRLVSVSGEIVLSYVRTPPPGEMLANVARGGSEVQVPVDGIPEGARLLFDDVDRVLARFPKRVYSVDCCRAPDGAWKIIELNAKPGLTPRSFGPAHRHYQERLAEVLLS